VTGWKLPAPPTAPFPSSTGLNWLCPPWPVVISDGANDYVYGPAGEPVEQVSLSTSTPAYLGYTPSGSSWLSTNQAGDETGFWRYDAFGTLAYGTPTSPFGYSGQYTDTTTGLVNDRARWYQGQTGEFSTRDPAFASTGTAYTYAGDDPVNDSDPSGWEPVEGPPPVCEEFSGRPGFTCLPVPVAFATPGAAEAAVPPLYGAASNNPYGTDNPPGIDTYNCKVMIGVAFNTPDGCRIPDGYSRDLSLAVEVKIGAQSSAGSNLLLQAQKDWYLKQLYCNPPFFGSNPVCNVLWSFWPSTARNTNPSPGLVSALLDRGIGVVVNYFMKLGPGEPSPAYSLNPNWGAVLHWAGAAGIGVAAGGIGWWILGGFEDLILASDVVGCG
jgi:RHS repeat-associated protein